MTVRNDIDKALTELGATGLQHIGLQRARISLEHAMRLLNSSREVTDKVTTFVDNPRGYAIPQVTAHKARVVLDD